MKPKNIAIIVILSLCILQYINTLSLKYALDDRLVIFQNDNTLRGFSGIKDVMTHDGFSAFFHDSATLVSGGRYRPLAQISLIVEYELFGNSIKDQVVLGSEVGNEALFLTTPLPLVSHIVNLILYLILVLLVYLVISKLFSKYDSEKWYLSFTFIATLLFALHPIHTEVVANIKGRDEMMTMIGGMLTVWGSLKYLEKRDILYLLLSFVAMLFGLFSKENAITFVAVIPLALYFSDISKKKSDWILTFIPALLASVIFLILRAQALGGFMPENESTTILNDPFIGSSTAQRIATVIFTWGIYLKLLIFPHPLCHDYYPNQIAITDFSDPVVLLLLLFFIFIVFYAIKKLKSKHLLSFAILFFIITFSIVSNLLINIGTFLNERFVFVSSLGFALVVAYYINLLPQNKKINRLKIAVLIIISAFYLGKGISRNLAWRNDFTLFTTDIQNCPNSIKCNVSAGGKLLAHYKEGGKEKEFKSAVKYLEKAISMDKYNFFGHLLLGDAYYHKKNYPLSLVYYKNALAISPINAVAKHNVWAATMMLGAGKIDIANSLVKEGKPQEALSLMRKYFADGEAVTPSAYDAMGRIFGMGFNRLDSSEYYLKKAIALDSTYSSALENMGVLYAIKQQYHIALQYLNLAKKYDPHNTSIDHNIASVKANMRN
ncbi:MAG: glycosyltransferase family 39 protein [Bacteroidales bacterium]|nr:glycosyltransferase family 39 protein [Bacteroidales bacterium]